MKQGGFTIIEVIVSILGLCGVALFIMMLLALLKTLS